MNISNDNLISLFDSISFYQRVYKPTHCFNNAFDLDVSYGIETDHLMIFPIILSCQTSLELCLCVELAGLTSITSITSITSPQYILEFRNREEEIHDSDMVFILQQLMNKSPSLMMEK